MIKTNQHIVLKDEAHLLRKYATYNTYTSIEIRLHMNRLGTTRLTI